MSSDKDKKKKEESESESSDENEEESEDEGSSETSSANTSENGGGQVADAKPATQSPLADDDSEDEESGKNTPKTKESAPSPRPKDDKKAKAEAKKQKSKEKEQDSKKKTNPKYEQTVEVVEGRTIVKKTYDAGKDSVIEFKISAEHRPYKSEEKVEIRIEIKNQASKIVKSIKCVLETKGIELSEKEKKKKKKPKKGEPELGVPTGSEEEFYCGARFPLEQYTDFRGTCEYRLPPKPEKSSDHITHDLHLAFPIRSRSLNRWKNISVWLPIQIA